MSPPPPPPTPAVHHCLHPYPFPSLQKQLTYPCRTNTRLGFPIHRRLRHFALLESTQTIHKTFVKNNSVSPWTQAVIWRTNFSPSANKSPCRKSNFCLMHKLTSLLEASVFGSVRCHNSKCFCCAKVRLHSVIAGVWEGRRWQMCLQFHSIMVVGPLEFIP